MSASKKFPFPGMHPFFQQWNWVGAHTALIHAIWQTLSAEMPEDLSVQMEEAVTVSLPEEAVQRRMRADVAVIETDSWKRGLPPVWSPETSAAGGVAVDEPLIIELEPETQRRVEIRDERGQVITVIEVLSPTNKTAEGVTAYRQRQQNWIQAGVNLVEIDLIRGGQHAAAIARESLPRPAEGTTHLICVSRASRPSRREVYLCPLRQKLPVIRVPLRAGDPDVPLPLQPLIESYYVTGHLWKQNHAQPLQPPLPVAEEKWVDECLRGHELR